MVILMTGVSMLYWTYDAMEINIFFMTRNGGLLNCEFLPWAEKYEV